MRLHQTAIMLFPLLLCACGTRSIVVPVTRPALIDLHRCNDILIASCDISLVQASGLSATRIARTFDDILPAALNENSPARWRTQPALTGSGLFLSTRKLRADALSRLQRETDVSCVLALSVLQARYQESMLTAPIQSSRSTDSEMRVRKGRAALVIEVVLIDTRDASVTFADSLRVELDRETHAVDSTPAEIDLEELTQALVTECALLIAEATKVLPDREVVTFLLNPDHPEIETAIELAGAGRWMQAAGLLDSVAVSAEERAGSDRLWYNLGLLRQYAGDFAGALAAFENARRILDHARYRAAIHALLKAEGEYLEKVRQRPGM
jgi:hypothetical protein